ncbi:MAG: hypothetical protein EOM37_07545 [Proteobacteria bacterium]|jgi:hypothetical protein|nr:hypothetical protein [Alphaproteobacteria bacterium]NCC03884.1 hypothetical protein [Pseudomonadota bacterium]
MGSIDKKLFAGWGVVFIAPPMILIILAALWVSVSAVFQNRSVEMLEKQIVSVVYEARRMNVSKMTTPEKALFDFGKRLTTASPIRLVRSKAPAADRKLPYGFEDPWGNIVPITFDPPRRLLHLDLSVDHAVCRKVVSYIVDNIDKIPLAQVQVSDAFTTMGRLVYSSDRNSPPVKISENSVYNGCGQQSQVDLNLWFYL